MNSVPSTLPLTGSLEDYLETILLLDRAQEQVRVKDIAEARAVQAPSVSLALGKLADLGLVNHDRREEVTLTPAGQAAAQRVLSRHHLLTRFFREVLGMAPIPASEQACAVEHVLTDDAMDRLARFFEFLAGCPSVPRSFLEDFHGCPIGGGAGAYGAAAPVAPCRRSPEACAGTPEGSSALPLIPLADLEPGRPAVIAQLEAVTEVRRELLAKGLLPGAVVTVHADAENAARPMVELEGRATALSRAELVAVLVRPAPGA